MPRSSIDEKCGSTSTAGEVIVFDSLPMSNSVVNNLGEGSKATTQPSTNTEPYSASRQTSIPMG